MSIKLSIVIPAYNEAKFIGDTLDKIKYALQSNHLDEDYYEIIVCDNNSTDQTGEIASQRGAIIVNEPVKQIARARNAGAMVARGDWILFIDADSFPSPGLISDALQVMSNESIVGCGSTIRVLDGPKWFRSAWHSKNWSMRAFGWCPGAFILCRRSAFQALNGFSIELYAFEEADFIKRLKKYGLKIGMKFLVLHQHPVNTSGRKGNIGFWRWVMFSVKFYMSPKKTLRNANKLSNWYDR